MFNEYPHTDLHELNLDWVIKKVKELSAAWVETSAAWQTQQEAFDSLRAFVNDYFDNLDVQEEINNKIDDLVTDGTLSELIAPYVASGLPAVVATQLAGVVAQQITSVVAAQLPAQVAAQLPAIAAQAAADEVSAWLVAHINPDTGYVIDDTLTVQGAAADAKAAGDAIGEIKSALVPHGWVEIDASTIGFTNGAINPNKTFDTSNNTRQFVILDPEYNYFVWSEDDADVNYFMYKSSVILANAEVTHQPSSDSNQVVGFIGTQNAWTKVLPLLIGGKYNVLYIRYHDNSEVTSSIYSKLHIYRTNEKTYKLSDNLFVSAGTNFVNNDGTYTSSSLWYRNTPYIAVDDNIRIYVRSVAPLSNVGFACYDADNEFLGRVAAGYVSPKENYYYYYADVLENTAYVICTFFSTSFSTMGEDITLSFDHYCNYTPRFVGCSDSNDGAFKTKYINKLPSLYSGKIISFLGDSITTYAGDNATVGSDTHLIADGIWTYAGNHCRYPQNNLFNSPFYCYWVKLFLSLGMTLGENDSWAGSRVSWDGTTESGDIGANIYIASPTRIGHLDDNGTPDVILVNGGTNDIIQNVPIGTFNTENPSNYSDAQIASLPVATFADAYRALLIRLLKAYPNAKIVCMLPNYAKSTYYNADKVDQYVEVVKTACDYFGVNYIDMRQSGITIFNTNTYLGDGIHPNEKGMQLLFENLYKFFLYEL